MTTTPTDLAFIIPPALGIRPPSGADVVLLDDVYTALQEAGINPLPVIEPISWTPPSNRPVIYREEILNSLFSLGIAVEAGSVYSTSGCPVQPIDDSELDALLALREEIGEGDTFRTALLGALDGLLTRLYTAERRANHA